MPAAFGRLCVETTNNQNGGISSPNQPPSGGCVLKQSYGRQKLAKCWPAAFGRLCVETDCVAMISPFPGPSRLRAAVC